MSNSINYHQYLKLDAILHSQTLQSDGCHDEMLFIIIHQAYELWFKQIIHELNCTEDALMNNRLFDFLHKLKRIRTIIKLIVSQVDVLETMSPDSFASFRNYLGTASGFQSAQFHETKRILGICKESNFINFSDIKEKKNFWTNFLDHCIKNIQIKHNLLKNFSEIQSLLITIYYEKSFYTQIAELIIDIDEGIQEWRYRHVKLVERIIGSGTSGTGGSEGFEYLKRTITESFCHELWKIRSIIFNTNNLSDYFAQAKNDMIAEVV